MSEPARYPCGTIAEMAAIPLEARPRFLAELPKLLEIIDATAELHRATQKLGMRVEMATPVWVDDDKGTTTISVTLPN